MMCKKKCGLAVLFLCMFIIAAAFCLIYSNKEAEQVFEGTLVKAGEMVQV